MKPRATASSLIINVFVNFCELSVPLFGTAWMPDPDIGDKNPRVLQQCHTNKHTDTQTRISQFRSNRVGMRLFIISYRHSADVLVVTRREIRVKLRCMKNMRHRRSLFLNVLGSTSNLTRCSWKLVYITLSDFLSDLYNPVRLELGKTIPFVKTDWQIYGILSTLHVYQ